MVSQFRCILQAMTVLGMYALSAIAAAAAPGFSFQQPPLGPRILGKKINQRQQTSVALKQPPQSLLHLTVLPPNKLVPGTLKEDAGNVVTALKASSDGNESDDGGLSFSLPKTSNTINSEKEISTTLDLPWINIIALCVGILGILVHQEAWASFFSSLGQMKANSTPGEFSAAFNFWVFAAVFHPILQPILWISEVLHGLPGPKIADLVPVTFIILGSGSIYLFSAFAFIRNAVAILAISALITFIGAGLDGQTGLGDYNIQLDDSYEGKVVKGCPPYEDLRQSSMDNFDMKKYEGLWYWQKVHDWTQFKELYDTTLDIKLSDDGSSYTNNLGIKGPSPKSNPLSWDKSPIANGAHYFWFGEIDKNDLPGLSREKGFGVEFPNYIIDVQTNDKTGEYKEAIQFQCIEVGGVRLYEGIDFMSRNPKMSDQELTGMHDRARKAGLYPYGANPEQMHRIERSSGGNVENSWQTLWQRVGVDKLLELVTESTKKSAT